MRDRAATIGGTSATESKIPAMSDDRKYRHRGYQSSDDSRDTPKSRGPNSPPPPKKDGPRGRGLGAPTSSAFRCPSCNTKRPISEPVEIGTRCSNCEEPLHCCAGCTHFDTSVRLECRKFEEIPARIAKKRDGNQCTFFEPKTIQEFAAETTRGGGSTASTPSEARSAFDALFKNI